MEAAGRRSYQKGDRMRFVVSPSKLVRSFLLRAALMILWMGTLDLGMVGLAEVRRLQGAPEGYPHALPILILLLWSIASVLRMRLQRRAGLTLLGRHLTLGSTAVELAGPSYLERRTVVVTTRSGPLAVSDLYESSLSEICDQLNLAWSNGEQERGKSGSPALPRSGIPEVDAFAAALASDLAARPITVKDHGVRWFISPGWILFGVWILMMTPLWIDPDPSKVRGTPAAPIRLTEWIHELEVFRNSILALFTAYFAIPGILLVVKDPTRRYHRWILISPRHLILSDTTVRIIPTGSVSEVMSVTGRVWSRELGIQCRIGRTWRFPDLSVEREVAVACGLDPDRHIGLAECASRLGCSRIRAWMLLVGVPGIRPSTGNFRRAEFERQFSDLRARIQGRS